MMLSEEVVIDRRFGFGHGGVQDPIFLVIIFRDHTDQILLILFYLPELAVYIEVLRTELKLSCVGWI